MITEAQIDRALSVLEEHVALPYMARIEDYVHTPSSVSAEARAEEIAALRAADDEAEAKNRAIVRRVLEAALEVSGKP